MEIRLFTKSMIAGGGAHMRCAVSEKREFIRLVQQSRLKRMITRLR